MLSAVSQQVQCIQEALREHSNPSCDKSEASFFSASYSATGGKAPGGWVPFCHLKLELNLGPGTRCRRGGESRDVRARAVGAAQARTVHTLAVPPGWTRVCSLPQPLPAVSVGPVWAPRSRPPSCVPTDQPSSRGLWGRALCHCRRTCSERLRGRLPLLRSYKARRTRGQGGCWRE